MTPRISEIAGYMAERHNIYLKRLRGEPGPWTDDPILRDGRFCNVFRELDTVTIWVRKNIRERFADHEHLWFMLCIARYINWPDTLQQLISYGWPDHSGFRPELLTTGLQDIAAGGKKVYTGAYMIRAESDPNKEWYSWTKHRYIAEIVLGRVWEKRRRFSELLERGADGDPEVTLERVWNLFQAPEFVGWGPFMAYEVVTDLRHTRYLREAPDIYTWANAGPGAIRGLNRLYGRDLKAHPPAAQTNAEMRQLMEELNALAEDESGSEFEKCFTNNGHPSFVFEMRDVEHTLCEFDKYERVRLGEGKMRSKYNWRNATTLAG